LLVFLQFSVVFFDFGAFFDGFRWFFLVFSIFCECFILVLIYADFWVIFLA